jgi:hypothetical protein
MADKTNMIVMEVTPSQLKARAIKLFSAKKPFSLLVQGYGGTGKTSLFEQIGAALGKKVYIVRGSSLDPVDLSGMPHMVEVNGQMRDIRSLPSLLPAFDEDALVFFDEINRTREEVMQTFLRVLEGRGTDGYRFNPDRHRIAAAFNPNDGTFIVNKMDKVLPNRGFLFNLKLSLPDFLGYMYGKGYETSVMNYLTFSNKSLFVEPNAEDDAEVAWSSPRSWENLAALVTEYPDLDNEELLSFACAAVGVEQGADYVSFRMDSDRPVRAMDILTDYTDDLKKKFIRQQAEKAINKVSVTMSDMVYIINSEWKDEYLPKLKSFWTTVKENELKAMFLKGVEAAGNKTVEANGKPAESIFDKIVFGLDLTEELSTLLKKHDDKMKGKKK